MFEPQATAIPGCHLIRCRRVEDPRGSFMKTFHEPSFREHGLRTDWKEEYCSTSRRGVIRGMHFQVPPADHCKLVFCLDGAVVDVILDLRRGSPAYGRHQSFSLTGENGLGLHIPSGCAHGFVSTTDVATMYYKVTSVHSPEQDAGVAWNSFGFDWEVDEPLLSERDRSHPALADFESPFVYA
jgi:dTDP-4-dehydrorhamnose 3,5-epimerase